ncbi:hypothetical protein AK812_SmicGene8201 [Symbiodinium microadriaticum]|uniref:Uncharacterized protein n=1 Tax=Symbiodinium microadriaticum TaxID=2951 RepID=A0A1Q9ELM3_SYMMI|nr:hypothetical protein AK812_SmicGene8201 [Symbiodinium microadriaticum]
MMALPTSETLIRQSISWQLKATAEVARLRVSQDAAAWRAAGLTKGSVSPHHSPQTGWERAEDFERSVCNVRYSRRPPAPGACKPVDRHSHYTRRNFSGMIMGAARFGTLQGAVQLGRPGHYEDLNTTELEADPAHNVAAGKFIPEPISPMAGQSLEVPDGMEDPGSPVSQSGGIPTSKSQRSIIAGASERDDRTDVHGNKITKGSKTYRCSFRDEVEQEPIHDIKEVQSFKQPGLGQQLQDSDNKVSELLLANVMHGPLHLAHGHNKQGGWTPQSRWRHSEILSDTTGRLKPRKRRAAHCSGGLAGSMARKVTP